MSRQRRRAGGRQAAAVAGAALRRALVTGASSGIGAAVAARLAADGYAVTGLSRRPAPDGAHVAVDLADAADTARALAGLAEFDAIVHAAGVLRVGRYDAADPADARLMYRLHVEAAAQILAALTPRMPDGGRIVLIGSRASGGARNRSAYAASKGAVVAFARSLAAELIARRITVNVVAPGATDTAMAHDPARAAEPQTMPPLGRLVEPEEVAALVAFLLSPPAAPITGQQILICGGQDL